MLSGRGGFELLLKSLRVGIAVTASVSAASSLAVEIADETGATLVGFVRGEKPPRVYSDDGRPLLKDPGPELADEPHALRG